MEFTQSQVQVLFSLTDGIFPGCDAAPRASELPVAYMFMDIAKSWPEEIFISFSSALDIINDFSLSMFGVGVAELDDASLAQLVTIVSTNTSFSPFWEPFRTLMALLYYGLPAGYLPLGMPGPSIDRGGFTADGEPA